MRILLLGAWVTLSIGLTTALIAHPGDNGYWLIEVSSSEIESHLLLPDHLLMHLLGPDQYSDRDAHPPDLMSFRDEIVAVLSDHLRLQSQPALIQKGPGELHREPGGFLEFVTLYERPAGTENLTAASSLQELAGGDYAILCRVIGGEPESFLIDSQTTIVAVRLGAPGTAAGTGESSSRESGLPLVYGLLCLPVLGLAILGLRLIRNRQQPGRS